MKFNHRAIYGCTAAPTEFECPQDCRLTYNPTTNRLYVHIFAWPLAHLFLYGLADKVAYAQILHDASEIRLVEEFPADTYIGMDNSRDSQRLILELPALRPDVAVPVIELILK